MTGNLREQDMFLEQECFHFFEFSQTFMSVSTLDLKSIETRNGENVFYVF